MRKILYFFLVILCLVCIYYFSSKNSYESNQSSKKFIQITIEFIEKIAHKDLNEKKLVKSLNTPIRKVAHFTIFFILGTFLYLFINSYSISNKMIICILICLACAIADETHQIFSLGRSPLLFDIIIDTFGSILGIILSSKFF